MARNRGQRPRARSNLFFARFLIVAGIALFLANLNLLPLSIHEVWKFWPLIFVVIGLGRVTSSRKFGRFLVGVMFIVGGAIYTLSNIGALHIHMHDDNWPLALLFLGLGIGGLARVLDGGNSPWQPFNAFNCSNMPPGMPPNTPPGMPPNQQWPPTGNIDTEPILHNYTVMGMIKRKVESQCFQGGSLTSIMGNIQIDLRRSNMPVGNPNARVEVNAIMGAVKLRVPESWRVVWAGDNVMGVHEDRTFPPIGGVYAPTLVLTGSNVMGKIEIES